MVFLGGAVLADIMKSQPNFWYVPSIVLSPVPSGRLLRGYHTNVVVCTGSQRRSGTSRVLGLLTSWDEEQDSSIGRRTGLSNSLLSRGRSCAVFDPIADCRPWA